MYISIGELRRMIPGAPTAYKCETCGLVVDKIPETAVSIGKSTNPIVVQFPRNGVIHRFVPIKAKAVEQG